MGEVIQVVGAVIVRDGEVLCALRGPDGKLPGKWEFPGGKLEAGEKPEVALRREIEEELSCDIDVQSHVVTTEHEYDFATIALATYLCSLVSGEPLKSEHAELRWLAPRDLESLDWAPADIPAVEILRERWNVDER
jgi:8-oxo-dGTP diphosphatase